MALAPTLCQYTFSCARVSLARGAARDWHISLEPVQTEDWLVCQRPGHRHYPMITLSSSSTFNQHHLHTTSSVKHPPLFLLPVHFPLLLVIIFLLLVLHPCFTGKQKKKKFLCPQVDDLNETKQLTKRSVKAEKKALINRLLCVWLGAIGFKI